MKALVPILIVLALIGVVVLRGSLVGTPPQPDSGSWVTLSCEHMATTINVTVPDDDRASDAGRIVSEVFGEVDRNMSEWKEGSPLTHVNRMAGKAPGHVPPDLLALLERSLDLARATDGAFDPTWAALWGLWDFKAASPVVPDDAEIDRRVALVDYTRVRIDAEKSTVYLPEPGMLLGLGGIAKGYALDVAAERLRRAGFTDFMIVGGGQVYAAGSKGDRPWRVGIRDPRGPADDFFAIVELRNASLSTSGDYERFFEIDGHRYHHILDPRTGRPAAGPRSVTVISADATLADAMSTALMIVDASRRTEVMAGTGLRWALIVDQPGRVSQLGDSADAPPIEFLKDPKRD